MFGRLLLLSCCCAQLLSASGALGFAYVNGTYRSDGRSVRGNATLFGGTIIETDEAPAKLDLDDGTRAWLTPHSKIRVTARRLLLLEGLSEVHSVGSHDLAAGSINIRLKSDSITRVAVDATHGATVVSVRGTAAVSNANGVLVGSIGVGQSVRFTAYEGAAKIVQSSGCLERRGDGFALTDRVTNVTFRLNGRSLDDAVGRVISIRGYQEGQRADGTPTVKVTAVDHDGNISCGTSAHRPVLVAAARAAGGMQAPATKPVLNLVVVEGDGAINNIQQRTAREPIVE